MRYKVNSEGREGALGYKVNSEGREGALGYKVNSEGREGALGFRKIDLIIRTPNSAERSIFQTAKKTGVRL